MRSLPVFFLCIFLSACPRGKTQADAGRAESSKNEKPGIEDREETAGEARPDISGKTLVVLLGTGTPIADPDRSGPSVAVIAGGVPYIVDFGPGVVRRAAAAYLKGVSALAVENLRLVFVTHLHSDHTAGYADLILTPWVMGRKDPLDVYGPPGLKAMTDNILEAYVEDIEVRLKGNHPAKKEGYKVFAHEVSPGLVYEDENVKVKAFGVKHGAWKHAYGYRFETEDRSIVISGDTIPMTSIIESCSGCDVLIHEVYSKAGFDSRPPDWQAYHKTSHTSSIELARIASEARPGLLILYHQLLWGSTPEQLMEEIRKGYKGKVVYGNDLDIY